MPLRRPHCRAHEPETAETSDVEVSFSREIEQLRLGAGEVFHGEGILAITKALLQSGVA